MGRTLLEEYSVQRPIRDRYLLIIDEINTWLESERLGTLEAHNLDDQLPPWMETEFLCGAQPHRGSLAMAAVKFMWPDYGRKGSLKLPRSDMALRGWKRRAPPGSRLPLPWEVVALLAEDMFNRNLQWLAFLTVLTFHCYFRPIEPLRLRAQDLIPPLEFGGHVHWSITLHPIEHLVSSKTQEYDETVMIDKSPFLVLGFGLQTLRRTRAPLDKVFPGVTQAMWSTELKRSAERCGCHSLQPHLYALRHGGASHDRAHKLRPALEVKLRGRWGADQSVRRYDKHGRVAEQLHRLEPTVRRQAASAPERLAILLATL